jgi:hypothetical protein
MIKKGKDLVDLLEKKGLKMNKSEQSTKKVALHSAMSHLNAAQREIDQFDGLKELAEKIQSLRFDVDQEILKLEDEK